MMALMYVVSEATKLNRLADALAKALEYVEFDVDGHCVWCEGWEDDGGHAPDCQRQVALREYREVIPHTESDHQEQATSILESCKREAGQ